MIKLNNIKKSFGKNVIFENVNISINTKCISTLVGINGSGKTTLINLLSGVDKNFDGKYTFDGIISTCYSDDYIPKYSSLENLVNYYNFDKDKFHYLCDKLMFNSNKMIYKLLSYGNKQKFKIIFTLLQKSEYYLFDEPTNGLDFISTAKFIEIIQELKIGALIITHDFFVIDKLCDNLFILDKRNIESIELTSVPSQILCDLIFYEKN